MYPDANLDSLLQMRYMNNHKELFKQLLKKLHFTTGELESVFIIYLHFQKDERGLPKEYFKEILHKSFDLTDPHFLPRIIAALEKMTGKGSSISLEAWATCLSLFLRGSLEEQIRFCFSVYDKAGTGFIETVRIFQLLRYSVVTTEDEEEDDIVKDMILSVILKKMDLDKDGKISFNDYRETVLKDPILLECFGQCLPSKISVMKFLTTFSYT